jgi:Flp pilus assembly protein TadD
VTPRIRLGEIRIREGRISEAVDFLSTAVTIDPHSIQARYYLGLAIIQQGDIEGAIRHYNAALEITADNADIHNALSSALCLLNSGILS